MDSSHSQRLHDLKTVLIDFKSVFHLLKGGYRFDDEDGPRAICQLEKALGLLQAEVTRLSSEWGG